MTTHVNDAQGVLSAVVTGSSTANKLLGGSSAATGSVAIATGLTTILGFAVSPVAATASTANAGVVLTATASGGTLTIRRWKHTGVASPTLVTATVAGTVSWIAVGT